MILVDTSVWIEHLQRGQAELALLLEEGRVLGHRFVTGEVACGNLRSRARVLELLERLPQAAPVSHRDVLELLARERLFGRGLGWIDVHLLASARAERCGVWSRDLQLRRSAAALGLDTRG